MVLALSMLGYSIDPLPDITPSFSVISTANNPSLLAVHHLNEVCWQKCITSKITSGTLDKSEEACAQNCVDRWMDTSLSILQKLENMRGH
jgi:hypothetical protein